MGVTYNSIRAEKIKSKSTIEKICRHNFRIGKQPANVNSQKSHLNKIIFNSLNADTSKVGDFCDKLDEFYTRNGIKVKEYKKRKLKQTLALEWVASASHDFFKNMTLSQVEEWASNYLDYLKNEFGDCVKMAALHLDEHTPHLHVLITPEEQKTVIYKNRDPKTGEVREYPKTRWGLNADRWDPEFMEQVQTRSHEWMKRYYPNLERGVAGSTREHVHQKEFYAQQAKAMKTTSNFGEITQKAIDGLNVVKLPFAGEYVKLDEVKKIIEEKLAPAYNRVKFIETMKKFSPNALTYKAIRDRKKKLDNKEDALKARESTLVKAQHNVLDSFNNQQKIDSGKDQIILDQSKQILNLLDTLDKANEKISLLEKVIEGLKEKFIPGYKTKKSQTSKI
ncbi:TPA: plasmid recombination protein [Burkholderia aenigmatica]|uniref:plasmid recombination protein n=1 Tax=Burkholderia sp. AU45251 TaxID=3059204 RepID=UPI00264EEA89|nr:plasmid recombination protein [Burkholderia sp. AU45251]HDR9482905.1 plasmid recombination protein [Burkholderia aenigmatica]MDN7520578.1 plasmid recombination protein [Burkholderia sp. AU45251]HDR9513852.1 plasmid recombination protein [Burkholderia aenigmatica]HDR9591243.1 plasmid recombination protein [Burkholderia aenigmatica]HDR9599225.1 plasmid recombination protein [Burkholderia aenigmatica]